MSHVFGRHTQVDYPIVASGEGAWLVDNAGKRYIDAGDAAVSCLGHNNPRIVEAVKAQLDSIAFAHSGFFSSQPAETLASRLVELAPPGIERVYFVSGGSEAVEAALKLSRQYFIERQQPQREFIIARRQSYHGNTLGALAAGGNEWRRAQFKPLLSTAMHHIDPCYFWRWGRESETPEQYGIRMADQLEQKIRELGEERVAAFIAEPVVGATLGAVAAEQGYFKRIREICTRYGVLLILDEVMCGMGRTGTLFASEAEDVVPDIVCVAKGLGAGVQPIGATLCSGDIYDAIASGSGFFQHGHTYLAHASACAAGLAVVNELTRIQDDGLTLVQQVAVRGPQLMRKIEQRIGNHQNVGDVRGRGFFMGVELVADRDTREPLDPLLKTHAKFKKTAFSNGLMVYPMGGTVDGKSGDHVLIAPPFIADDATLDELVERLAATLFEVLPPGG